MSQCWRFLRISCVFDITKKTSLSYSLLGHHFGMVITVRVRLTHGTKMRVHHKTFTRCASITGYVMKLIGSVMSDSRLSIRL